MSQCKKKYTNLLYMDKSVDIHNLPDEILNMLDNQFLTDILDNDHISW